MDRAEQARVYRREMGDEAADRQEKEAEKCSYCNATPGDLHAVWCRLGKGRKVAKRRQGGPLTRD